MKIYVKTDQTGKVIEACPSEIKDSQAIECTQQECDQIMAQYDCMISNGSIASLAKGANATRIEAIKAEKIERIKSQDANKIAEREAIKTA